MKILWPRTIRSAVDWVLNLRPRSSRHPRRIAGVMSTKNYAEAASTFHTLKELCDVVIVLDDNSTAPFPHRADCTEYISLQNQEKWNATANLTLLLFRAFVHGCEWVVSLDDDIILSSGLRGRGDVEKIIDRMEAKRLDICHFRLRDLWNTEREVRVDGIWSHKTFPVVRRNWFFNDSAALRDRSLRLHTAVFPANLRARGTIHPTHVAYHAGCLTPNARRQGVEKYRREDPENTFQADYSYILDERELALEPVPEADLRVIRKKLRARWE